MGVVHTKSMESDPSALDHLIAEVVGQEERLQFTTFSSDDAWMLGSRLRAFARSASSDTT